MPTSSMTGFARREGAQGQVSWAIEARSVNGRNLDIKCRYPQGYEHLDRLVKDLCKTKFQRGQVTVSLQIASETPKVAVTLNQSMIDFYLSAGSDLIRAGKVKPPRWDGLLSLRGVIETAVDETGDQEQASFEVPLIEDINQALDDLKTARRHEGQALFMILHGQLQTMAASRLEADALAGQQVVAIKERFARRLSEMLPDAEAQQDRILQEAAVLAVKADVTEELDRLRAHITAAHELLAAETSQGRKLDFLAQEFMREANTLCSKAATTALTAVGLNLKSTIDQFREQIQNVE